MAQYPFIPYKYGSTPIYGSATAAGVTTIGTPPNDSTLRLLLLEIPEDATTGSAGENQIQVLLNSVVVFQTTVYMGTAGGGTGGALGKERFHSILWISAQERAEH